MKMLLINGTEGVRLDRILHLELEKTIEKLWNLKIKFDDGLFIEVGPDLFDQAKSNLNLIISKINEREND